MLKHLDLFSGIGGWTLGFHATEEIETVGFCEIEKYPQQILKQHYPNIPIFEDVKKLDYEQLRTAGLISDTQRIDILTCSYPCQPFSVAGKKQGEKDERHLWPEVHRLIRDDRVRPMYVLGENVGGHIRQGLDTVSEDMERCGYRWRCFSIEAACIGANHRRQRVWWIAEDVGDTRINGRKQSRPSEDNGRNKKSKNKGRMLESEGTGASSKSVAHREEYVVNTDSLRQHEHKGRSKESKRRADSTTATTSKDVADSNDKRSQREEWQGSSRKKGQPNGHLTQRDSDVANTDSRIGEALNEGRILGKQNQEGSSNGYTDGGIQTRGNWDVEPNVGRVANGVPNRVHRLKALGNAIVPQMAYYIGTALIKDFQNKNINKIGE